MSKLRTELKNRKITLEEVSTYISRSRPTTTKKVYKPELFTAQEIRLISEMLNVDPNWAFNYLFV
tara:strand:- start:2185 stop:2379 length:195 start_codon:yes stop_codon:yes gene_type:complete